MTRPPRHLLVLDMSLADDAYGRWLNGGKVPHE